VICTTGYSAEQVESIKEASGEIAIFYSGNMSLGVNLIIELAKQATKVLGRDFDIEIVEKHHNLKVDAPSGTALMIADGISEELDKEPQYVYDRHSYRRKRSKNEIGIHAIRGGTIVGEHDVIFAGPDEVVTISHQSQSKGLFATGALNAAVFLCGKPAGMYDMSMMLAEKLG
jgi:4-hydroxy-tetrahydrodipicolinate reductase